MAAVERRRGVVHAGLAAALAVVGLLAVGVAAAPAAGDPPTPVEQWYRLEIDGRPCGRQLRSESRHDGVIETLERTELAVSRDGTEIAVEIELQVTETEAGRPVAAKRRFGTGEASVTTSWNFEDDAVVVRESQGGRERVERIAVPPRDPQSPWLAPAQADAFAAARRAAGSAEISMKVLSFERGLEVVAIEATKVGEERFPWEDREIPATRWRVRMEGDPTESTQLWSRDGRLLESTVRTGLGDLKSTLCSAEAAARWRDGALPDLIRATVIPIAGTMPRRGEAALRLSMRGGSLPDLPENTRQSFTRIDEKSATVVLFDSDRPSDGASEPPGAAASAASAFVDLDDPLLRELALERGPASDASTAATVEGLRRLVRGHLRTKDLSSAFASASEAARSRQGDCSEHATLLCALLRIRGIPARVAVGLVHADRFAGRRNVFAWHVWTQAWIDGGWRDVDATEVRTGDARRIAVAYSDLAQGAFDPAWSATLPLMGGLEITVTRRASDDPEAAR